MSAFSTLRIEVAYALPAQQVLLKLNLPGGATVESAILHSGVLAQFPDIDLTRNKVGIFSKIVTLDTLVRDRDRIEIYRPLIADPKEIRRQRANAGKSMKKGKS